MCRSHFAKLNPSRPAARHPGGLPCVFWLVGLFSGDLRFGLIKLQRPDHLCLASPISATRNARNRLGSLLPAGHFASSSSMDVVARRHPAMSRCRLASFLHPPRCKAGEVWAPDSGHQELATQVLPAKASYLALFITRRWQRVRRLWSTKFVWVS